MTVAAQAATAFTEATVHVDDFEIRYLEAGSGEPLVFLHGAGGPAIAPAHEILASEFRVILFEMPGFGTSPANTRHATAEQLAETMHKAARQVAGPTYTLAGTSFGSGIASWIAVRHPGDIDALVLLVPAVIRTGDLVPMTADAMLTGQAALYAHPEKAAHSRLTLDRGTAVKQAELLNRLRVARDNELEIAYRTLAVPTLLLFGTADRIVPSSLARRYVELNREFTVLFVYDAAHVLEEERPEATANAISNFARNRLAFSINHADNRIFP